MKKETLYNFIFPLWLVIIFPPLLFLTLIGNFVVTSLVLILCLWLLKLSIKKNYWRYIWKIWVCGFVADLIGVVLISIAYFNFGYNIFLYDHLIIPLSFNPINSIYSCIFMMIVVLICGICIYFFNRKATFAKLNIENSKKRVICFIIAMLTAPYFFFLPTEWFLKKDHAVEIANPRNIECLEKGTCNINNF